MAEISGTSYRIFGEHIWFLAPIEINVTMDLADQITKLTPSTKNNKWQRMANLNMSPWLGGRILTRPPYQEAGATSSVP